MSVDKRKRIYLNGVDSTDFFTPTGMSVQYSKIQGDNGGTFLTGEREEDILAWKATVTLTCMPMTDSMQRDFLAKIFVADPTLTYFDPIIRDYKTIHYMVSISETVHRGYAVGRKEPWGEREFWTGLVLTAEEK